MSVEINKLVSFNYNKPVVCEKCGRMSIKYLGIGEYSCADCNHIMYDDYGKVRRYIENNPGATQIQVANALGIPKSKITQMLKDDKIEIAPGSMIFLNCELCGKEIRSGRFCFECAKTLEERENAERKKAKNMAGYINNTAPKSGEIRFKK